VLMMQGSVSSVVVQTAFAEYVSVKIDPSVAEPPSGEMTKSVDPSAPPRYEFVREASWVSGAETVRCGATELSLQATAAITAAPAIKTGM